jgi:hypothetical protein
VQTMPTAVSGSGCGMSGAFARMIAEASVSSTAAWACCSSSSGWADRVHWPYTLHATGLLVHPADPLQICRSFKATTPTFWISCMARELRPPRPNLPLVAILGPRVPTDVVAAEHFLDAVNPRVKVDELQQEPLHLRLTYLDTASAVINS